MRMDREHLPYTHSGELLDLWVSDLPSAAEHAVRRFVNTCFLKQVGKSPDAPGACCSALLLRHKEIKGE